MRWTVGQTVYSYTFWSRCMQPKIIKAHRSARTSAAVLITLTSCTIWLRNPISNSSCHVPYLLHSFLYLTRSGNRVRKRCLSLGCHGGEAAVADADHVYLYTWVCVSGSASVENLFFFCLGTKDAWSHFGPWIHLSANVQMCTVQ